MQRTKNFTQTSGSHTAQGTGGQKALASGNFIRPFIKQVTVNSTVTGFGLFQFLWNWPFAWSPLWTYTILCLYLPLLGEEHPFTIQIKSALWERNWMLQWLSEASWFPSYQFQILLSSFQDLPLLSNTYPFPPWLHLCLYSFCCLHLKLLRPSSCSGSLRLHLSSTSSVKISLFPVAFLSTFNQYPHQNTPCIVHYCLRCVSRISQLTVAKPLTFYFIPPQTYLLIRLLGFYYKG